MTVKVKITQTFGKKPPQSTTGDFSSFIAAVKFVGDYMLVAKGAHRGIRRVELEIIGKDDVDAAASS